MSERLEWDRCLSSVVRLHWMKGHTCESQTVTNGFTLLFRKSFKRFQGVCSSGQLSLILLYRICSYYLELFLHLLWFKLHFTNYKSHKGSKLLISTGFAKGHRHVALDFNVDQSLQGRSETGQCT